MSKPKGPKLELPDDLVAELAEDTGAGTEGDRPGPELEAEAPASEGPDADDAVAPVEEGGDPEEPPLEAQLAEARDRHLRLAAEFENFKRRTLKERHDMYNYANENLIKELLPTVDNLERALEHAQQTGEGEDVDKFLEGVELTYRSLMQILEKFGVQVVEGKDAPFDPQVQEAIRQVPAEGREPGTVVEIYQRGYQLKNRLLRPALVAVSGGLGEESE